MSTEIHRRKPTILTVDDEPDMLAMYQSLLKKAYRPVGAQSGKEAVQKALNEEIDLVLLDIRMPGMDGVEILAELKRVLPEVDVIMVTASKDIRTAVDCMKLGAYDFIPKPFEVDELQATVNNALEKRSLKKENEYLRTALEETAFPAMMGESEPMRDMFRMIHKVADSSATVLVLGESGTGKELVAHAIHKQSPRKEKPFVVVNCAAIPEALLESELFGHEKGAFTGAVERREGKFELADGGTIFMDEIGCMPLPMQSKLLRVLQSGEVERVGSGKTIQVDVRVISATNSDLKKEVAERKFREDLYYRLNVVPMILPPLRERGEDTVILAKAMLEKFRKKFHRPARSFAPEVLEIFRVYPWPGNVRELQNLVERVVTLSHHEQIDIHDLPSDMFGLSIGNGDRETSKSRLQRAVEECEKGLILKTLKEVGNNQSQAARILEVHRTTLVSKMAYYSLR